MQDLQGRGRCGREFDVLTVGAVPAHDLTALRRDGELWSAPLKAQLLGEYEVFHGSWKKLFEAPAEFERVTAAQVQSVARDVLNVSHRTVGVLLPDAEETLEPEPELEDA